MDDLFGNSDSALDDEFDDFFNSSSSDVDDVNGNFIDTNSDSSDDVLTMDDLTGSVGQQNNQFNNQLNNQQVQQNLQNNQYNQMSYNQTQFNQQGQMNYQQNNTSVQENLDGYWNQQQNFNQQQINIQQQNFDTPQVDNQQLNNVNNINNVARRFNLSKIQVGFILFSGFIFLAILLLFVSHIHLKPKNNDNIQQESTVSVEQPSDTQPSTLSSSLSLTEIPSSTQTNMSNDVIEAKGSVTGFNKYLLNKQIIYCINISVQTNAGNIDAKYFCTFSAYRSVNQGSSVNVKYQLVDDNYISITEMSVN